MYQKPVAVIMSVYKAEIPYNLKKSLKSLRDQTYKNLYVYLAQDGPLSTELKNVINKEIYDSILNLNVHEFEKNEGLSVRLNDLIRSIKNQFDYIARMDSDDVSINDRIQKQVLYMEDHKEIDVLGGSIIEVNASGEHLKEISYPQNNEEMISRFVKRSIMGHVTVMYRSSYFDKAGLYPVTLRKWNKNVALPVEDTLMWLEGLITGCKLVNLQEPLVYVTASEDYFSRRTGIRLAFVEYQIRNQIVTRLEQPFYQYIYAFMYFIARILPSPLKKIIWKLR